MQQSEAKSSSSGVEAEAHALFMAKSAISRCLWSLDRAGCPFEDPMVQAAKRAELELNLYAQSGSLGERSATLRQEAVVEAHEIVRLVNKLLAERAGLRLSPSSPNTTADRDGTTAP